MISEKEIASSCVYKDGDGICFAMRMMALQMRRSRFKQNARNNDASTT